VSVATAPTLAWANPAVDAVPRMVTDSPGPASREWNARMDRHTAGSVTTMVKLHPVAYASGEGVTLTDVDGNTYLDFSSGIVITNIGHGTRAWLTRSAAPPASSTTSTTSPRRTRCAPSRRWPP
jgi:4-aminobutyrate aminotransferase-like enzyme